MANLDEIRQLVGRSKIKKAIKELVALNTDEEDLLIGLEARFNRLRQSEMQGTISNENAGIELRQITASLLGLISTIEEDGGGYLAPPKIKEEPKVEEAPKVDKKAIAVGDEKGLEKIIGKNGLAPISWLTNGAKKAKSVGKIHTADGYVGTGFLIDGGYIFTNNHVIATAAAAQFSRIEFGYDNSDEDSIFYDFDHSDFITSVDLDFTRVKVKDSSKHPLSDWGVLSTNPIPPKEDDTLIIIQHPDGRPQELAFSDDGISIWEHRLHYNVTTEGGSSGSPVFDFNWNVVAVHHAGGNIQVNANGEKRRINEGILIRFIEDALTQQKERSIAESAPAAPAPLRGGMTKPVKTILIYNLKDSEYADDLDAHLHSLKRTKSITLFDINHDAKVGEDKDLIQQELDQAEMVLVLISSNLYRRDTSKIASAVEDVIQTKKVVPILVSPFSLEGTSFENLVSLPRRGVEGNAITDFDDLDETLMNIALEIKSIVNSPV